MKEITIKHTRGELIKDFFAQSIYLTIITLVLFGLAITNLVKRNNLFVTNTGVISEITKTAKDDKYEYIFKLAEQEIEYTVLTDIDIATGQTASVEILATSNTVVTTKILIDNVEIYNNEEYHIKRITQQSIILFILGGLALGFLIYRFIRTLTKPLIFKQDYVEFMLTSNKVITNSMFDGTYSISRKLRIYSLLKYVCFFICFVLVLLAILSSSRDVSKVIIGIYCVAIIGLVILIQFLHPRFYSKESDEFSSEYQRYLRDGSTTNYYNSPYSFLKEGLKYTRDEKVSYYDYHELNLYVVGLYVKKDYAVNLFICSDLHSDDETEEIKDFIIPLTHDEYAEIRQNGIFIRNLDYVLDNLSSEIKLHNKHKGLHPVVIKYLEEKPLK